MKIAVIGCGKQGHKHVGSLKEIEGADVIVADVNTDALKKFTDARGVPAAGGIDEVIESGDIGAIDICTPTPTHKDLMIRALKAGKHVFCEKPLCMDLDEAHEIRDAAKDSGLVTMIGYHHRFHPSYLAMKQAVDEDIIGKPYFSLMRMGARGSHQAWKHTRESGGGAIFEILVHKLAVLLWCFGEIKRARWLVNDLLLSSRTIGGEKFTADAEDCIAVQFETVSGVSIICQADLVSPGFMDFTEIHAEKGSVSGSILHFMPTVVFCDADKGPYKKGNNISHFEMQNLFKLELEHFLSTIKSGGRPIGDLDESIEIMTILNELEKNKPAAGGDWIDL